MTKFTQSKPAGTPTWIDITTPDIDAARAFYQSVFGWEYDIGGPEYGGYTTARIGSDGVAGLSGPMPGAPPMPTAWSLYFATSDIKADVARAVGLGAKVHVDAMEVAPFGSMAVLEDPTGAQFCFWQSNEHIGFTVTNEHGATAWFELYAPNAAQARDFYMALLNATSEPMPGEMEYHVLKHGDEQLAGIMQIDPSWGGMQPQWVTYFLVEDADAAVAAVVKGGGKQLGPIDPSPFGRIAALVDPAGATFKIVEGPAE